MHPTDHQVRDDDHHERKRWLKNSGSHADGAEKPNGRCDETSSCWNSKSHKETMHNGNVHIEASQSPSTAEGKNNGNCPAEIIVIFKTVRICKKSWRDTKGNEIAEGVHLLAYFTAYPKESRSSSIQTICNECEQDKKGAPCIVSVICGENRAKSKHEIG